MVADLNSVNSYENLVLIVDDEEDYRDLVGSLVLRDIPHANIIAVEFHNLAMEVIEEIERQKLASKVLGAILDKNGISRIEKPRLKITPIPDSGPLLAQALNSIDDTIPLVGITDGHFPANKTSFVSWIHKGQLDLQLPSLLQTYFLLRFQQ